MESKHLIMTLKSFARANAMPLDSSEIFDSMESAEQYLTSGNAYAGQTIKILVDGVYRLCTLQSSDDGLSIVDLAAELNNAFDTGISEAVDSMNETIDTAKSELEKKITDEKADLKTTLEGTISSSASETLNSANTYTREQIAALVNEAPETLDTLKEIADAIGDNKEFIDSVNEGLSNSLESAVNTIRSDYVVASVEETKEYIGI